MNVKRELPAKESAVFKNILKNYEHKQYKKGLKLADSILKRFPEHGETLAMKGLFLNNLDKKEEGYDYVKKGLRYDLTSHICWHVYGLLHRADKNYEEAAKCYTHALKYNKNDINILRDFALLQTQMRHYDALVETRSDLVQQKPNNPPFWIGLAVAFQLVGEYDSALATLKKHEENLRWNGPITYEMSELLMYHNTLLQEKGENEEGLAHLQEIEPHITDKTGWKELRASYLSKLGREEEAEAAYRLLISENPYNTHYIECLLKAKQLDTVDKSSEASVLVDELKSQYPRSKAIETLALHYSSGDSFRTKVEVVLQTSLRKGVPSLFNSMKKFYGEAEKQSVIESLVQGYCDSLATHTSFTKESTHEPPTAYLWTLYYLAQHYDYHRQTDRALEIIDKAIAHTPTVVELYMTKGRILKHAGKKEQAMQVMNQGRQLDLQDRFINSKCAKYMMRAGHIEEAEKTISLFTRRDVSTLQDLIDMQCQWFSTEEGLAYADKKEYGKALKRFHTVDKFYSDIFDDQFDFHTYCLRKTTLRAYVDMLHCEDHLRAHPYYLKAAKGAVQIYLALADLPNDTANDKNAADMTEAEKKKARNKARKAELKAQQDKEAKKAALVKEETLKQRQDPKKPVDQDPLGEKYVATTTPLEDALLFVKPLQQLAPRRLETHTLGFEIYLRQRQWLLALRCLVKTAQINKAHSSFKVNLDRFQTAVACVSLEATVKQVVDHQMTLLTQA
ncbi:NMDA receptor-regulated protein 1-domain-containing protein [Spinellus fusiger]|nr:NMDA receptor-regulated protein 1-domain-containing protein [Spinellus fusiger]KAI7865634.1 NMDA receptor-regulated protein 1-domain-containing protein [Spinellus fusiger]